MFADGREVVLEAQSSRLTDADLRDRHRDYQASGVIDVWLWHPDSPIPWVILDATERAQHVWMLDPWKAAVTLMVGAPHQHRSTETVNDVNHRVQHLPPCIGDSLVPYEFLLSDLVLTPDGITVPVELRKQLTAQLVSERRRLRDAESARNSVHSRPVPSEPPSITRISSGDEVDGIEAAWPVIRAKAREFGGGVVDALLSGVSVVRLEADTVVLAHQHAVLAQRLTIPKYADALRAAIQAVLGRDVHVQWQGSAVLPLPPPTGNGTPRRSAPRGAQRFDIQASDVDDFDHVFDLLQLAGARYGGSNREFVVEGPTFTFEQVWALLELVRHPDQPTVQSPWQPEQRP
ncbi:hypothetical protein OIE68_45470 [Nocardia vinacea]|uniref:hypothetical protein n=1 Tax=Nocardia vinacea TaxID=96468 RepID=UPI002E0D8FC9|nr:hypothetical protein OIE68_45470 [Nocardia vinacea]